MALEAVTKTDAIFDIEREINGLDADSRLAARQRLSRQLVADLRDWMQAEQDTMSRHNPVAKAIAYMFKKDRREAFTRFLDDGRICLTNNAAECADHLPLYRQSQVFEREGIDLDRSTLADWVGTMTPPILELVHVELSYD